VESIYHRNNIMKRFEFSLQYPKPLTRDELGPLINVAQSGLYSRYTTDFVKELEVELAEYYGTGHAITCTSGTGALHGVLTALDFPPGSEIIMTSVADIGIVLPVIYENLIPVFADLDKETYNIDPKSVAEKITKNTKAIIAVHLAGSPADLHQLKKLCDKKNIVLIEDFSQAHGAELDNKKVGNFGLISYGSFQQSKQITCGEGGVILTSDKLLADRALIGVDKGWERDLPLEKRLYKFLAPNVRFNALQAALLKPQISKLENIINRKRHISKLLYQKLLPISNLVQPQKVLEGAKHSYYSFPLYVLKNQEYRNSLLNILDVKFNMYCAYGYANPLPLYSCVNALINPKKYGKELKFSQFEYPEGTCPNAEDLLKRSFLIPFNENFSDDEMLDIGDRLIKAVEMLEE